MVESKDVQGSSRNHDWNSGFKWISNDVKSRWEKDMKENKKDKNGKDTGLGKCLF